MKTSSLRGAFGALLSLLLLAGQVCAQAPTWTLLPPLPDNSECHLGQPV